MNPIIKNLFAYLIFSFITAVIFAIILKIKVGGGQMVVMAPLYLLINSAIAIIISLVLISVIRNLITITLSLSLWLFMIVFVLTMFVNNDFNLFKNDIDVLSFSSVFISFVIFQLTLMIKKNFA